MEAAFGCIFPPPGTRSRRDAVQATLRSLESDFQFVVSSPDESAWAALMREKPSKAVTSIQQSRLESAKKQQITKRLQTYSPVSFKSFKVKDQASGKRVNETRVYNCCVYPLALLFGAFDLRTFGIPPVTYLSWLSWRREVVNVQQAIDEFVPNESCSTVFSGNVPGNYLISHYDLDLDSLSGFLTAADELRDKVVTVAKNLSVHASHQVAAARRTNSSI